MATFLLAAYRSGYLNSLRTWITDGDPIELLDPQPLDGDDQVNTVAVNPDSSVACLGGTFSPYARLFALPDFTPISFGTSPVTSRIDRAAFSPDGAYLALMDVQNSLLYVFETATWDRVFDFDFGSGSIFPDDIAFSADSSQLYIVAYDSGDGYSKLLGYETTGWTQVLNYGNAVDEPRYKCIAVAPDGTIAVGTDFYDIAFFQADGTPIAGTLPVNATDQVGGVAFSPDGSRFAAVSVSYPEGVQVFSTGGNPDTPGSYSADTMSSSINAPTAEPASSWPFRPARFASNTDLAFVGGADDFGTTHYPMFIRYVAGTWTKIGSDQMTGTLATNDGDADSNQAKSVAFYSGDAPAPPGESGEVEDALDVSDETIARIVRRLIDALSVSDAASGGVVAAIIERVGVNSALTAHGSFLAVLTEAVAVISRAGIKYFATLTDTLDAADSWLGDVVSVARIVDQVMLADTSSSRLSAAAAVALALTFGDAFRTLTLGQILETIEADDTVAARLAANAILVEMLSVALSTTAGRTAVVGLVDTVTLDEALDAIGQFKALLTENAGFEAEFILFGEIYQGWVVNNENGAPSEYSNFPFNSMARVGNAYYGASETGLYLMGGDSDDGDPIQARILTGEMDFGSPQIKRVERAYMGYTTTGDLVLKVIATVNGALTEFWYRATPLRAGEVTQTRVPIGRGIDSRYWQFEIVNTNGADFEIDTLDLQILNLQRRI